MDIRGTNQFAFPSFCPGPDTWRTLGEKITEDEFLAQNEQSMKRMWGKYDNDFKDWKGAAAALELEDHHVNRITNLPLELQYMILEKVLGQISPYEAEELVQEVFSHLVPWLNDQLLRLLKTWITELFTRENCRYLETCGLFYRSRPDMRWQPTSLFRLRSLDLHPQSIYGKECELISGTMSFSLEPLGLRLFVIFLVCGQSFACLPLHGGVPRRGAI